MPILLGITHFWGYYLFVAHHLPVGVGHGLYAVERVVLEIHLERVLNGQLGQLGQPLQLRQYSTFNLNYKVFIKKDKCLRYFCFTPSVE